MLKARGVAPQVVIEPSCGVGNFVVAALETFDSIEEVYGIEINAAYSARCEAETARHNAHHARVHIVNKDIFEVDMAVLKEKTRGKNVLILGNPPWVTSSKLGSIERVNLPEKSNFKKQRGLDAITGKGNFDIAESITYKMMELAGGCVCHIALLLKNSVIKSILQEHRKGCYHVHRMEQYLIDAGKEFEAAVSASLLLCESGAPRVSQCRVHDFYSGKFIKTYGWIDGKFVSDCDRYAQYEGIDGRSPLKWWSGIKHDCSKIMELERTAGGYVNGFNEAVDIEDGIVYPFLKSADIKEKAITRCRKYFILTQHHTGENTIALKSKYPKAYRYLLSHEDFLNKRKSIIYKNNYKFSIFGVGPYTFSKYKIVISGLYKQTQFSLASEIDNKVVLSDDTTYLMGFDNRRFAEITLKILNSEMVQGFINSILFMDAKRPINKDLLMRIDLIEAAKSMHERQLSLTDDEYREYLAFFSQNDAYQVFKTAWN